MKNKKIISILIALVISFTMVGCKSSDIKTSLEEGKKYLNSNEYEKAEESFENVLKDDKDNKEAKELIDVIKNYEEAKNDYDNLKLEDAGQAISKIPACYVDYGIKNDIEKLKEDINVKTKEQKEAKEKEAENKKLAEAEKSSATQNEQDKNNDASNKTNKNSKKEVVNNKKDSSNVKKPGVTTYTNKQQGFKIDLPASWKDHYEIKENGDSIAIVFKSTKEPVQQGGLLVSISKNTDDGSFLDNATYRTINGVKYVLGQPTDVGLDPNHSEYKIYSDMVRQGGMVNKSFRSID